jgi:hypothetical protein
MTTTNSKLAVRLIRLTNIGGIEGTLEIPLGDITYLEGDNGVGKSSAINGVAALCGAPVTDLLTQGKDEGEIYLELTDDTFFRRRITRDGKNILTAGHPDQGSIGKAAAWLKATLSVATLSPAEFLSADDAEAAQYILRTTPLTVTDSEIAEAVGDGLDLPAFSVKGHALTVLDRAIKVLYDQRTGKNSTAKDAKATAEQLARSIPEDVQGPADLAARAEELRATLAGILEEREAAVDAAGVAAQKAADAEIAEANDSVTSRSAEVARIEEQLRSAQSALEEAEGWRDDLAKERDNLKGMAEVAAGEPFKERQAAVSAELAQVRQAHETAVRAEAAIQNTREMIARQEATAKAAHARSQALTQAMARLDALKSAKAAELPIEGVSIENGKLRIDGVPAHRANTARRMRVAAEASAAQNVRIRFIIADDLEHLSTKTRREVEQWCRDDWIQILGARVTDDEALTVRAVEAEAVGAPADLES